MNKIYYLQPQCCAHGVYTSFKFPLLGHLLQPKHRHEHLPWWDLRNWSCKFSLPLWIWRCPASGKHQLSLLLKWPAQLLLKHPYCPQISPKLRNSTASLMSTVSKIPLSICYKMEFKDERKVCFLKLMILRELRNPALQPLCFHRIGAVVSAF